MMKPALAGLVAILAGVVAVPVWIWLVIEFIQTGIIQHVIRWGIWETVWPEVELRILALNSFPRGLLYVWPVVAVAVGVSVYLALRRWMR